MAAMRIHVAPMHVGGRKGNSKDREGEDSARKDNVLGLGQEEDDPVFVSDQSHSSRVPLQVPVYVLGQVQRAERPLGQSQLYCHQYQHLPSLLQRSE